MCSLTTKFALYPIINCSYPTFTVTPPQEYSTEIIDEACSTRCGDGTKRTTTLECKALDDSVDCTIKETSLTKCKGTDPNCPGINSF